MFSIRQFEEKVSGKFDKATLNELRAVSFNYRNEKRKEAAFWAAFKWVHNFKDYNELEDIFAADRTAKILCYIEGLLSEIEPDETVRLDAFTACGKGRRLASDGKAWSRSIKEAGEKSAYFDPELCRFVVRTSDGDVAVDPVKLVETGVIPVRKMKKVVRYHVEESINSKVQRKDSDVNKEVEEILTAYGNFLQRLKKKVT